MTDYPTTQIGQAFRDMLSRRLREAKSFLDVFEVAGQEFTLVDSSVADIINQLFVQTATWGLSLWEQMVGLPQDPFQPTTGITDQFTTDTRANYTYNQGVSSDLSVSGGFLKSVANPTTRKRMYQSSFGRTYTNGSGIISFTTSGTVNGTVAGIGGRMYVSGPNTYELIGIVTDDGTHSKLGVFAFPTEHQIGSYVNLPTRMLANTTYWVRVTFNGPFVTVDFWYADPIDGHAPDLSVTQTLTGSDLTNLGPTAVGSVGIIWTPETNTGLVNDWVWASADLLEVSYADRRSLILVKLQTRFTGAGLGFVSAVQTLEPGALVVSDYTNSRVNVKLAFSPTDYSRNQIEDLVSSIIPAHLDWRVEYTSFIAGVSLAGDTL